MISGTILAVHPRITKFRYSPWWYFTNLTCPGVQRWLSESALAGSQAGGPFEFQSAIEFQAYRVFPERYLPLRQRHRVTGLVPRLAFAAYRGTLLVPRLVRALKPESRIPR
jgi:hypothetical protein